MYFKLNKFNKVKVGKMYLTQPSQRSICKLNPINLKGEFNLDNVSNISFKIYSKLDGIEFQKYDQVLMGKLVKLQYIGFFQITSVENKNDGKVDYKEITAESLENELVGKYVDDINGVFYLYNDSEVDKSLLHIICKQTGNVWTVGHVDNELYSLARTFADDKVDAYNLLMDKIQKSFQCIVQFDTFNRKINCTVLKNVGKNTNILLTYRNLVQENVISTKFEDLITVFRVTGGDDLDIRAVNFGSNKITNLSFYANTDWWSQELLDAYNTYNAKCVSLNEQNTTLVSNLKTKYSEMNVLNERVPDVTKGESATDWTKYGYNQLVIKYNEHRDPADAYKKNGDSEVTSPQYPLYLEQWNIMHNIDAEMIVRKSQIQAKLSEIETIEASIDNIATQIDINNNFTSEQLAELNTFLNEGEYTDDTYVASDNDKDDVVIQIKKDLLQVASEELARVSQPQYTISTKLANLFTLPEFKNYSDNFELGNIVTVKFRDDYYATARLLSISIDFDNLDSIDVTFSNKNRLDDATVDIGKIINQAKSTSGKVASNLIGWDKAKNQVSTVSKYMTDTLNLATQDIISSDKEEVLIGKYGIRLREYDSINNKYSGYEAWFVSNKLLFSSDGFKSSSMGIGLFRDPDTNMSEYGIFANRLVGRAILGETLKIVNNNSNFTISNDGFIGSNGINTVKINPNEQNIFQILKGTTAQFYIDVDGNVCSAGKITGGSVNIGNGTFTIDSNGHMKCVSGEFSGQITSSNFTSGTISIGNNFTVDINGNMKCTSGEFSGNIVSSTININNKFKVDASGNLIAVGNATFGSETEDSFSKTTIDVNGIEVRKWITNPTTLIYYTKIGAGTIVTRHITCTDINGSSPITEDNVATSHGHSRLYANSDRFGISAYFSPFGNFASDSGLHGDLGTADNYWGTAYLYTAPTITSDRNAKNTIEDLTDIYIQLILKLKPVRFKYNNGSSGRFHTGYIAQDVEYILSELGLSTQEFAGLIKSPIYSKVNDYGEYDTSSEITGYLYSLRYEEFISPMTSLLQKINLELQDNKAKLDDYVNENLTLKDKVLKLENDFEIIKSKLLLNQ
jgi:hypothetical protein